MSDALLTRIAEAIDGLRTDLKAKPAAAAPAAATKPAAAAPAKPAAAPAAKPAAAAAAAAKPAAAAAKPAAAPAKAAGGKWNADQVKEIVIRVAQTEGLSKEDAKNILKEDGGGVSKISEVKPEHFDAVYEACQVALAGVGKTAPAAAATEFDPLD